MPITMLLGSLFEPTVSAILLANTLRSNLSSSGLSSAASDMYVPLGSSTTLSAEVPTDVGVARDGGLAFRPKNRVLRESSMPIAAMGSLHHPNPHPIAIALTSHSTSSTDIP